MTSTRGYALLVVGDGWCDDLCDWERDAVRLDLLGRATNSS